ncbi:MAG: hypothetical protein ACREAG_02135 [Nitrosopumilaceae archaeon]
MSAEILERVASAGPNGIKKTDLKKIGKNSDVVLQDLIDNEYVFVEKKGVAHFVWTRDNYILHLSQNDPKFKLIFNMVMAISHSVAKVNEHSNNLAKLVTKMSMHNSTNSDHAFKMEFDRCLAESSTSIGWTPFSQIRKKFCGSQNISTENFYTLAADLVERHREKYELSSGGEEGVIVRGLVHGFVRNV